MEIKNINQLLSKYSSLDYNADKTKIICEWSGHEMPLKVDSILTYVNGNKYKSLLEKNFNQNELKKYSEFLVPTNRPHRENQYFCVLTLRHLNKQPDHMYKHLTGKRFQKAYKHYIHCKETNQEFVPFPKQSQKKNRYEEKDDDDDDGNESDKMSDLFPEMLDLIDNDDMNESNDKIEKMKLKDDEIMDQNDDADDNEDETPNNKRKHDSKINKKSIEPKKKKQPKN